MKNTTQNNVGKDAAILTASKIITMVLTIASSMLLSRFRTLNEYGTYSQLLIVITLASSIFTLGLPNSTNYYLARAESPQERQQFLSVFYSLCSVLCVIMGIALVLAIPLAAGYFKNDSIRSFAFFLAIFPWTSVIIGSASNVLVVYGKTKKLMLLNIVCSVATLFSIVIVQILHGSFMDYMILYLSCEVGITIWVYIIVNKLDGRLNISFDRGLLKSILYYSIPIGIAALVGTICIEIDKLMIGRFFNTEQLAIYSNAAKELPLTIVASSLTAVLLPQMARFFKVGDTKSAIDLWGYSIRLSYIIICFCVTACVVFAPQIITILYSQKYLPGVQVFRVYSLVLLLRTTYFGLILNSIGKTKLILYSSILSLVLNCVLNYFFYLCFGFVGPAIATFLSIAMVNIVQLIATSKTIKLSFYEIFPWSKLLQITVLNIGIGVVAYAVVNMLKLGTDIKGITLAIVIGMVMMGIYVLIIKDKARNLWQRLNEK